MRESRTWPPRSVLSKFTQPCPCQDDFRQSFYTVAHEPGTPFGLGHRTIPLLAEEAMVNVDVVDGHIMQVEIIL